MHFGQMHFGGWWYEIISNRYKIDLMVKEKRRRKRKISCSLHVVGY